MEDLSLTIAVLSHNRARFVMQMVSSILSQTYRNFEVVVWDNASTDGTLELLRTVEDPRLSVRSHSTNIGPFGNMNSAVANCQTKYLLLTHDDDRMKPQMVATYVATLIREPGLTLLCCNADEIDESGQLLQASYLTHRYPTLRSRASTAGGYCRDYVEGLNYVICPTVLLNVAVLRESGLEFRTDAGPAGDSLFWCQLSYLPGRFQFLEESLFEYRIHRNQDSVKAASRLVTGLRKPLYQFLKPIDTGLAERWWKNSWPNVLREWFDWVGTPTRSVSKLLLVRLHRILAQQGFSAREKMFAAIQSLEKFVRGSALYFRALVKVAYYGSIRERFNLLGLLASRPTPTNSRVVLVTGALGYGGGPFTFFRFLVERLSRRYTVILSFRDTEIREELEDYCHQRGIRLVRRPDGNDFRDVLALGRVIAEVKPAFTVVNAGSFSQCFHLLSLRSRILYYSHSIWHRPLSPGEALFLPFFRRRNHRIVTVSQAASDSLKDMYFPYKQDAERVHWVYNGVQDRFSDNSEGVREPLVVLTLGSVVWYKNPTVWLRVANSVVARMEPGRVRFVWAGHGELLDGLRQQASEQVEFIGQVANPDPLLASCAVYFQPSRFESFGLGVCEAMMFGKPTVVTDVGALPELVVNGHNGFVVGEGDEKLMEDVLVRLLEDQHLRSSMGTRSRQRYCEHFTPEHWDAGFGAILEKSQWVQ